MTRFASSFLTLWLLAAPASAQLLSREFTNAVPPSPRALERLNLKMAWRTYLPVDGKRDGINTVQILDDQILVQTVSGVIIALDPEKGTTQWKVQIGVPYRSRLPLGYNQKFVFALREGRLFALDRATGQTVWRFTLPNVASAPPVADEFGIYLALGTNRIYAYILPDLVAFRRAQEALAKQREREKAEGTGYDLYSGSSGLGLEKLVELRREPQPEPELAWETVFGDGRLNLAPLQLPNYLLFASGNGTIFSTYKFEMGERYRFKAEAPVSAPMGQYGNLAYIGSEDYNLYALDIPHGEFLWRFIAGGPLLQKPAVTDRDVYAVARLRGLFCVNRETGKARWRNQAATHFLAVNRRFVYATDRDRRLLVLDRFRGLRLGMLDTRDFVVPISNELTDRVYLASHNGLFICLRDLDQRVPLRNKNVKAEKARGFKPPDEGPIPKEKPKKKKEEKKEEDNDKGDKE